MDSGIHRLNDWGLGEKIVSNLSLRAYSGHPWIQHPHSIIFSQEGKLLSVVYRNPALLHLMWADDTKLMTASPETPGTITIINYW